jgi:hypothetical protein
VKHRQFYQPARHPQPARPRIFPQAYPLRKSYVEWLTRELSIYLRNICRKETENKSEVEINYLIQKVFKRGYREGTLKKDEHVEIANQTYPRGRNSFSGSLWHILQPTIRSCHHFYCQINIRPGTASYRHVKGEPTSSICPTFKAPDTGDE